MYIKRRQVLIAMLVMSQLGCMAFGVLWASQWLHAAFNQIIHRSVTLQAESLALTIARQSSDLADLQQPVDASGSKDSLQRLVEQLNVPHDGFVSIVRTADGKVIAATLAAPAGIKAGTALTTETLQTGKGSPQPLLAALAQDKGEGKQSFVSGMSEFAGQPYAVTALGVPQHEAAILVALSDASVNRLSAELVTPMIQVGFVLTGAVVGATAICTIFLVRRFDSTLLEVSSSLEREVERRTLGLQRSRNAVVFGLAKLAESRDKDAGQHLERLRTYVTILASELAKHNSKIDHHYVANLAIASALHDVGKMGVPDAVILKLGKLTAAERRAMQMHTVLGDECLASVERMLGDNDQFLTFAREVAAAHHEQWDGSGYPYGLQGKDIPLAARIVALADVYDALTSHREYRPAASHAEAREWIVSHYGSQFDPEVVEAFIAREVDFAKISQAAAQLDERRVAASAQTPATAEFEQAPATRSTL
ncbi:HD-GYP domain-containing protein [Lacipirellula parvula]|uniref:HD-GYP domain n=1 Tax=Lacipirellula parvula TaxID=2650471 RepID=A0A5K7X724_9BACT|nr:HD domain-containing phosphohydrolase [Lacipirellula parvula]BBO32348.1 HD-GYP domain [Lacipirellula parvula]